MTSKKRSRKFAAISTTSSGTPTGNRSGQLALLGQLELAQRLLHRKTSSPRLRQANRRRSETRYVDWLVPGILAMNMMFSALFGVGYTIVRYRKSGVLKRFKVTPVKAFEFLVGAGRRRASCSFR